MSRSEETRRRPAGLTLLEVGILLLVVAAGGWFLWGRMQTAKETSIRASAKAQLEEMGVRFTSAEDAVNEVRNPFNGPMIVSVSDRRDSSSDQVELIAHFPETKTLIFLHQFPDDEDLAGLSNLTNLEHLSVEGSLITDDGLALLKNFSNLRSLDLRYSLIKGPGLKHLRELPRLEQLCLMDNELTDDCVSTLLELKSLKVISLDRTFVSSIRISELVDHGIELKSFPFQMSLVVSPDPWEASWISPFSNNDLRTFQPLKTATTLEPTNATWQTIRKLALSADSQIQMLLPPDGRVTCLRVRGAKMKDEHFQALARMRDLRSLDLAVSRFLPDLFLHLDSLSGLRRIDLTRTDAGAILATEGNWLSRIESLHLRDAKLSDNDLKGLSRRVPVLRILDLGGNPITSGGVSPLAECGTLEELSLARTGISAESLVPLAKLPSLRRLDLRSTNIREADVQSLRKKRPNLKVLVDPPKSSEEQP